MNKKLMFSSKTGEWCTPKPFFNKLNDEFNFTLDPCSTIENHLCEKYYTKKEDGLIQDWSGETVYVNPPYMRGILKQWVKKCYEESRKPNTIIVMLIPSRTDTKYFHEYIYGKAEIRFIKGRITFVGAEDGAPFPSMVVIFR